MTQEKRFDLRSGYIWFDGKFVDWKKAKIHVLTHGLHYGSCVFEGARVYDGKIFKLIEHTERLFNSAKLLGLKIPFSKKKINAVSKLLIKKQKIKNGYLRPFTWRGSEMMAISAQKTTIHVALAAWEMSTYFKPQKKLKGIKLQTAKWQKPSPNTAPTQAKAAGLYMICTLAKHIAEENGCQDALMLDHRGYIAETTSANIFMVINDEIHTPTPDCFLNGITRQEVIKIARKEGIPVIERHIKLDELSKADEVFVTGTAAEVTPVSQIGEYSFKPSKICKKMIEEYTKLTLE